MNPGPVEEASKVAATTVEALKQTPLVLALVIFNVLFMLVVAYLSIKGNEQADKDSTRWQSFAETAMKACQPRQQ